VTTLADLEARVAALEADRADYRAVLAAVGALNGHVHTLTERVDGLEVKTDANRQAINALGEKLAGFQAETRERFDAIDRRFEAVEGRFDALEQNMNTRFRSVDEGQAELKDLIIDRLGRRGQ
jgi:predicted RNase H-like nuclease (RuvC/YqgF family)